MIRIRTHHRALGVAATVLIIACAGSTAQAQGTAVLTGTIRDTVSTVPVPGAVVTVTSPSLQGEQTVVTDASGHYRIAGLPPGTYLIRVDKADYRPFARPHVNLRIDTTIRYDGQLLPETLQGDDVVVITPPASVIDVGSSGTGIHVGADFLARIPLGSPGTKGAVTQSFESIAEVAPGGGMDRYGAAIGGATSPENHYLIDGLSVNDPGFGVLGTPLSTAFIKEVNVLTGGYLPEYGRATGGHFDVVTKSGSNELHGSIFLAYSPGIFEGRREQVGLTGNAITTRTALSDAADVGAELGGPIVRDKLWFYAGVSPGFVRYRLDRGISALSALPGQPGPGIEGGVPSMTPVADTAQAFYATQRSLQAIGKLTWRPREDHTIALSIFGAPTLSGGEGTLGFTGRDGAREIDNATNTGLLNGSFSALAHRYVSMPIDTVLKWSAAAMDRRILVDTTVGWHHQEEAIRASDGSRIASGEGLSTVAQVFWQRTAPGPHSINDFEASSATRGCDNVTFVAPTRCPVSSYWSGGPGYLAETTLDRWEGKSVLTLLLEAAGPHVVKLGADAELLRYQSKRGYSGTTVYAEGTDGKQFVDFRRYGSLASDGQPITLAAFEATSTSTALGGFLQDSYAPTDNLTFNVGVRYDAQLLHGDRPGASLSLPRQWAPRIGVIYDPTGSGRSRIFASYARYYEGIPLDVMDRSFSGERQISSTHDAKVCDPRLRTPDHGGCESDASRQPTGSSINPLWSSFGNGHAAVDPDLAAESSDELVIGGEYEIAPATRLGVTYTKRWQNKIIEDMSRDDATTFFVGNPGFGVASDFPMAKRDYDAITLYLDRAFRQGLLVQASYTVSSLRGNWAGLFRAETGQLDPNMSSDFDLVSLLPNRSGPLPGDHTHQLKVYAAKDFDLGDGSAIDLGIAWRERSGEPTTYLGSHPIYGPGEVYILPRGSGERLPWVHAVDLRFGVRFPLVRERSVLVSLDVFNAFNFQAAVARDQRFTLDGVRPIDGGTVADLGRLQNSDGTPFDPSHKNASFGDPIAYQPPRAFRMGITTTF